MKNAKGIVTIILLLVFTGIGFFIGRKTHVISFISNPAEENAPFKETRGSSEKYQFINPLWECDCESPSSLLTVRSLNNLLEEYTEEIIDKRKVSHLSIYFRDLNNGPWIGINEKENFSPASLLKLPVMIAALKKCETDTGFLKKEVLFTGTNANPLQPNIKGIEYLQPGNTYTIEDLLFRMIAYSDNNAMDLIVENAGGDYCAKVMLEIGVDTAGLGSTRSEFVSVKDYSSFFRLLYNATYLNKELSEKALAILNKTSFDMGIVAGVPVDVRVAHKFGERAFPHSQVKQLHDCGIVYYKSSPYLLCVMTRGNDFAAQAAVIAEVSKIVFSNVSSAQSE